jgi:hypothetical protein
MLSSTGKGICDSVTNTSMSDVRYGTAAFQSAKPEPTITGSYSFDCTYYILANPKVERQAYWFSITQEESSGQMEGVILRDNPSAVSNALSRNNFRQAQ